MEWLLGLAVKAIAGGYLLHWADEHQAWIVLVLCILGLLYLLHQGWLANRDWVHETMGLLLIGGFLVLALGAAWVVLGKPGAGLFGGAAPPAASAPPARDAASGRVPGVLDLR